MKSPTGSAKAVSADTIVAVFEDCFFRSHYTRLAGGAPEPFYEPPRAGNPARICFREDYAASALHEVAHWCIAGAERRRQVDYGYWYADDGRSHADQQRFEQVEARPQALEWCFSQAAQLRFRLSLDNLDSPPDISDRRRFAHAVCAAAAMLRRDGLPPRAQRFFAALAEASDSGVTLPTLAFDTEELW
jgi:hypothetical protein